MLAVGLSKRMAHDTGFAKKGVVSYTSQPWTVDRDVLLTVHYYLWVTLIFL